MRKTVSVFSLPRAAALGVLALLLAAAGAQQASARYSQQWASQGELECGNALNASAAERHCPALNVYLGSPDPLGTFTCFVWGSCTLTVPVGDTDTSFQLNVRRGEDSAVYGSPSEIRLLDFCFSTADDADEAQGGWEMSLNRLLKNSPRVAGMVSLGCFSGYRWRGFGFATRSRRGSGRVLRLAGIMSAPRR